LAAFVASSPRLTGLGAILAAVGLALFEPAGPWQPIGALLAWVVVLSVALALLTGRATGLAVGASLTCIRLGIHGVAGDRTPGLVASAFLLIVLVEMGADSIESRRLPMATTGALLRSTMAAAAGAGVVGVLSVVSAVEVGGPARFVVGLAAAVAVGSVALFLARSGGNVPADADHTASE
jgi:hypothetical protein